MAIELNNALTSTGKFSPYHYFSVQRSVSCGLVGFLAP
jgi:hypothetical protein